MLEYIRDYFQVKNDDFDKKDRDMIAVTLKKIVQKERKAIRMLCHMAEQPKLKRYE